MVAITVCSDMPPNAMLHANIRTSPESHFAHLNMYDKSGNCAKNVWTFCISFDDRVCAVEDFERLVTGSWFVPLSAGSHNSDASFPVVVAEATFVDMTSGSVDTEAIWTSVEGSS